VSPPGNEKAARQGRSLLTEYTAKLVHPSREGKLPRFVRDLIASPPTRGAGLNLWLFRASRVLHPYRNDAEIVQLLASAVAGEPLQPGEIERAVERSRACAWTPGTPVTMPRQTKWPSVNQEHREAVIRDNGLLVDLWEASPHRFDDSESQTEWLIDQLFPGNPLLCVGKSNSVFCTRLREQLRGKLSTLALIVPSPMTARTGITQDGKESEHTLETTGPRRFLIVEQDAGSTDQQAAVLLHLAKSAPLALAVHSGSKSLHGWFYCTGQPEEKIRCFMRQAVGIGADPATWTRSQFVRMPDGTRDNGKRQTVYFLNPEVIR
jgi:hypothetical protein